VNGGIVAEERLRCAHVFAVCLFAAGACATAPEEEHPIVRTAQFDLAKLSFVRISDDAVGVTGCGRRIKYVRICRQTGVGMFVDDECQWVAN
jgi:hypothetical protein